MFVPSAGTGRHRLHFGDDSDLVKALASGVEAAITGDQMYKIGMGQAEVEGLIAYARPLDSDSLLVIARWFEVPGDAEYLDTPMDSTRNAR